MQIDIKLPVLSSKMKNGKLVKWHVHEGDIIKKDDLLFEVTVNKMSYKVHSDYDGVLSRIVVQEGSVVGPGAVVAQIDQDVNKPIEQNTVISDNNDVYKEFDIIILGGGPGGYVAAIKAAKSGLKTAIIEKELLGGTCLNRGCIPTKAYARAADVLSTIKRSAEFGIAANVTSVDFSKVVERKNNIVNTLRNGVEGLLTSNGVEIIYGKGTISKEKEICVEQKDKRLLLKAKNIIIATGSEPANPPIPGVDNKNVLNSNDILEMNELPKSICVIGGGVIGMEFAFILNEFGVNVSVVEMMPNILPNVDTEISDFIEAKAEEKGIKIYKSSRVEKILSEENGGCIVTLTYNESEKCIYSDKVLISIGRRLNTDIGDITSILEMERHAIKVDNYMRTNVDGIYAIGDITGKMMLAHVASAQGEVAVDHITGHSHELDYGKIPAAVFTETEIGFFGYTEEDARKEYGDVSIGKFSFAYNGRALTYGSAEGFVKIIARSDTKEIVGAWVVGSNASELIHIISTLCQAGVKADEIKDAVYSHPTKSEAIMEAVKDIFKQSIHKP